MRKFVTVVLLLLILCGCTSVKNETSKGEIVIGSDQFEPFSYIDNGEMRGIDVDIAKEAFSRMGYTPVFKYIEWQKKDEYLRKGEIDCLWGGFSMNDFMLGLALIFLVINLLWLKRIVIFILWLI